MWQGRPNGSCTAPARAAPAAQLPGQNMGVTVGKERERLHFHVGKV